jgi:hypothetical protein
MAEEGEGEEEMNCHLLITSRRTDKGHSAALHPGVYILPNIEFERLLGDVYMDKLLSQLNLPTPIGDTDMRKTVNRANLVRGHFSEKCGHFL